ncbi:MULTISPECIES: phytanoyl-CoA dioxygenase family protein [unclassified Cellvibrio]|uniref:phytanoyl-CoA dioxygenase family protein n=1 Tax=unclassified Cellvibrio TaxID=2624793 RepID=UPI000781B82D|nr:MULTISPECIES: phytanoyl-CoA dioxygenase family protein [unclassified Cellvibrio]QEY17000.1 phytanoyl-CoA dioxygenase [Cellvibrio sp. KY-GH-1]
MNYQQLAEQFWRDGYIMLENFFSAELMDSYNQKILDHFGESPEFSHNAEFLEKSETEVIPWFPQREGEHLFDTVEHDPRLVALTQAILGDDWYTQYCMVMFSRQGTKGQAWHQDCPPEDSSRFNMNRLIYTMDITEETGGYTMAVKGSHKIGLLPACDHDVDFPEQQTFIPKKGTLILLHGHTWHKVLPVTGKYRVSTNYRSAPIGTPENITDICVYRNMRYQFSTSSVVEDRLQGAV